VVAADGNSTTPSLTVSLPESSVPRGELRTDVGSIISLIVLVVVGLAYCFSGFSLFKPTLFMTGFFIAANVALMALDKSGAFPDMSPTSHRLVYLAIAVAAGLLFGCVVLCCYGLGIYLIGLLGGYVAANLLISVITVHLSLAVRIIIIVVFCIVGLVLIRIFEKAIIIIATAMAGAYVTLLGIDMVLNKGIAYDMQHDEAPTMDSVYEVVGALCLAFVGIIVQFVRNRNRTFNGQPQPQQPPRPANPYGKYP